MRFKAVGKKLLVVWRATNSLIQLVAALIGIAAGFSVITAVVGYLQQSISVYLPAIFASIFLLVVAIIVYAFVFRATSALKDDVLWRKAEFVYTISDDETRYVQIVKIEVEALRDGVCRFRNKYWWTGLGNQTLKLLSGGRLVESEPVPHEAWLYYTIDFGKHLIVGERETVIIEQVMTNVTKPPENILSKIVTEPINKLTLEANLPKTKKPKRVYGTVFSLPLPINQVGKTRDVGFDDTLWRARWEIDNPKLYYTYTIRWEY